MTSPAPLRALWTPVVLIATVAGLTWLAGPIDSPPALINLILAVGLYVFAGNSGVLSFGQVAFMALGAYTCALLTVPVAVKGALLPNLPGFLAHAHVSTTAAVVIAAGFAGAVALVVAIPLMRLSGLAAGIATLALLVIVTDIVTNDSALTGGSGNIPAIPTDLGEGKILAWACAAIAVAFAYQQSRFCRRLRASREDEPAARSIGVRVERERQIAFVISAVITGVAGALYAHSLGSIGPGSFDLRTTFLIVAMVVVGGIRSLRGAVTGAVVLSAVTTVLDKWEQGQRVLGISIGLPAATTQLVLAVLLIAVLVLRPEGLSRGREVPRPSSSSLASERVSAIRVLITRRLLESRTFRK
jgi:branched-chain amino acid transport system permease protein